MKFHSFDSFFEDTKYDNDSGENFWGNAGAGVLPICEKTGKILVTLRSSEVNEPHTWGILGGKLEDGETPEEGANREMVEESGEEAHELIPAFVFKSKGGGFSYHNFIGLCKEEFEPHETWEIDDWKWVTLSELKKIEPKHFGLKALLKNSTDLIEKYAR